MCIRDSSDSAEQIGFYWSSNDGETTNNLNALVVLYNPDNISKWLGWYLIIKIQHQMHITDMPRYRDIMPNIALLTVKNCF